MSTPQSAKRKAQYAPHKHLAPNALALAKELITLPEFVGGKPHNIAELPLADSLFLVQSAMFAAECADAALARIAVEARTIRIRKGNPQ